MGPTADLALSDFYCESMEEAFREAGKRRTANAAAGMITRVELSKYSGYRVFSLPAEIFVDDLSSPRTNRHQVHDLFGEKKVAYQ